MANAKDKAAEEVEREELIPRPADCEEAEESSFEDESFTVIVNEATGVKPSKGRIQVQSEGAELFVRKIELTPIK